MAKTFRHSVTDGWIFIDNNTGVESKYPYAWWITQEAAYTYPSGATYLQYTEGGTQSVNYYCKNNSVFALPEDPWLAGNGYIAKQAVYDAAYAAYIGTPTTLAAAKAQKIAELYAQMEEIRAGQVIFGANTYESGFLHYRRLKEELSYSTYLTDVPVGYYVNDINDVQVAFTLANLQTLVGGIEKLYYLCYLQYDVHKAAINALGTINDVVAYDVTTGWPTVPFTP